MESFVQTTELDFLTCGWQQVRYWQADAQGHSRSIRLQNEQGQETV